MRNERLNTLYIYSGDKNTKNQRTYLMSRLLRSNWSSSGTSNLLVNVSVISVFPSWAFTDSSNSSMSILSEPVGEVKVIRNVCKKVIMLEVLKVKVGKVKINLSTEGRNLYSFITTWESYKWREITHEGCDTGRIAKVLQQLMQRVTVVRGDNLLVF